VYRGQSDVELSWSRQEVGLCAFWMRHWLGGFVLSEPSLLEVVSLESDACAGAGCVDSPAFSALEPLD